MFSSAHIQKDAQLPARAVKQREAQIVYIRSTQSILFVQLPSLRPYFNELTSTTNFSSNDIFYQLKSFKSKNRFYNLLPGDSIQLYVEIYYKVSTTQGARLSTTVPITIELNETGQKDVVTALELVYILNDKINKKMKELYIKKDSLTKTEEVNFLNFFQQAQFIFDAATGKLGLELSSTSAFIAVRTPSFPQLYQTNETSVVDNGIDQVVTSWNLVKACISEAKVTFRIPDSLQNDDELRLARMFGIVTYISMSSDEFYDENTTLRVSNDDFIGHIFEFKDYEDLIYKKQGTTKYAPETYNGFRPDNNPYQTRLAPSPMDVHRHETLYVRSSLETNIWSPDGRRTNVIATIPVGGNIVSGHDNYTPPWSGDRLYNIKDSVTSMQSFNIMITDEYDVPVEFVDEYEMEIAIFFMPKDPQMTLV